MENATTRCTIKNVRLNYMHLLEARAAAIGAEPKFSLTMMIAKTDEDNINAVKASIKAAIAKKYGETKPPKGMRNPLRDKGVAAGLNDLWITKKGEALAGGGTDWGNIEAEDFGSAGLEGLTDGEDVFQ